MEAKEESEEPMSTFLTSTFYFAVIHSINITLLYCCGDIRYLPLEKVLVLLLCKLSGLTACDEITLS